MQEGDLIRVVVLLRVATATVNARDLVKECLLLNVGQYIDFEGERDKYLRATSLESDRFNRSLYGDKDSIMIRILRYTP
jgi:hypothetical protein